MIDKRSHNTACHPLYSELILIIYILKLVNFYLFLTKNIEQHFPFN
ncbi:putative membrane protein [Acinetobacter sp. 479375]|nr:putative membrane protein [Acinetobacter sp. 479375]